MQNLQKKHALLESDVASRQVCSRRRRTVDLCVSWFTDICVSYIVLHHLNLNVVGMQLHLATTVVYIANLICYKINGKPGDVT